MIRVLKKIRRSSATLLFLVMIACSFLGTNATASGVDPDFRTCLVNLYQTYYTAVDRCQWLIVQSWVTTCEEGAYALLLDGIVKCRILNYDYLT